MKVLFEPQGAQEFRVAVLMKRSVVMEGRLALEDLLAQRLRYQVRLAWGALPPDEARQRFDPEPPAQGTGRRMSAGEQALVRALSRKKGAGGYWAGAQGGSGVDPALAAKFGVVHMEEVSAVSGLAELSRLRAGSDTLTRAVPQLELNLEPLLELLMSLAPRGQSVDQ